jgi:hypothetical protein
MLIATVPYVGKRLHLDPDPEPDPDPKLNCGSGSGSEHANNFGSGRIRIRIHNPAWGNQMPQNVTVLVGALQWCLHESQYMYS